MHKLVVENISDIFTPKDPQDIIRDFSGLEYNYYRERQYWKILNFFIKEMSKEQFVDALDNDKFDLATSIKYMNAATSKAFIKKAGIINITRFKPDILKSLAIKTKNQELLNYVDSLRDEMGYSLTTPIPKEIDQSKMISYDKHGKGVKIGFKRNYMIYRLLDFINKNPGIRRKYLTKFVYELKHGKGAEKEDYAGYWSQGFMHFIKKGYIHSDEGRYTIEPDGIFRLRELKQKFGKVRKVNEGISHIFQPKSKEEIENIVLSAIQKGDIDFDDYKELVIHYMDQFDFPYPYFLSDHKKDILEKYNEKKSPLETAKFIINKNFKPSGASSDGRLLVNPTKSGDSVEYKYYNDEYPKIAEISYDVEMEDIEEEDEEIRAHFITDSGEQFYLDEIMRIDT